MPRVSLQHIQKLEPCVVTTDSNKKSHVGLTVYNLTTDGVLEPGTYIWDGAFWQPLNGEGSVGLGPWYGVLSKKPAIDNEEDSYLNASVTIGSVDAPNSDALLDLQQSNGKSNKGLLLPRVALSSTSSPNPMTSHIEGMAIYNIATVSDVTPGYYYNDGTKWVRSGSDKSEKGTTFSMPSTILPTSVYDPAYNSSSNSFTVDLYDIYQKQYTLSDATSSSKSPSSTPLNVIAKNKLDYFVTYFDNQVFKNVKINDNGVLTYELKSGYVISEKTFMNIIFKIK